MQARTPHCALGRLALSSEQGSHSAMNRSTSFWRQEMLELKLWFPVVIIISFSLGSLQTNH